MEINERAFKGVWIPAEIWLNTDLSILDKGLLAEISSLDGPDHCYASNKYLAQFCGVSIPTITRSIKKLSDLGLISTEMIITETGTQRIIKMMWGYNQNDESPLINLTTKYNSNSNIVNNNELSKDNSYEAANNSEIPHIIETKNNETEEITETKKSIPLSEMISNYSEKPKSKRKSNLYQKCIALIDNYTNNAELRKALIEYLDMNLQMKDKAIKYENQWKGKLKQLDEAVEQSKPGTTHLDVVNQSIRKGWGMFAPVKDYNYKKSGVPDSNRYEQKIFDPRVNKLSGKEF